VTKGPVLLDTGPLVSFLASGLKHHTWTVEQWKRLRPPLLTCEPVLTEACFLLTREGSGADAIFELLERKVIRIALSVQEEQGDLRALNAPLSQQADVFGGCLPGAPVGDPQIGRDLHARFGFSHLSMSRQQGHPGTYALSEASAYPP
jgi:hypothetical protein